MGGGGCFGTMALNCTESTGPLGPTRVAARGVGRAKGTPPSTTSPRTYTISALLRRGRE